MNILFLMADEFRFNAAGFMGNPVAQTPHLDRLAAGAFVSENAYTPSPVCIPARQCLATGRYPLHIGCERFGDDIAPGSATFARWFTDHGYYTVACGKLHHRGPDQMQGWMHRIGSETAVRWPAAYGERAQIGRRKWRGAEDIKNAGVGLSPLALHDEYSVQGACDFARMHFSGMTAVPADTPLLLMLSLQQPHFPLLTEQTLYEDYRARVPVWRDQPAAGHPALDRGRLAREQGITEDDARRATAAYYGMVEQTDRRIGRLLQTLEDLGQNLDEWIIVFTSDHGDMLGEHGVWEKRSFYEGSARVPLLLRGPGITPQRSTIPANLVDLFPTLAALGGLPAPQGVDGHDLLSDSPPTETFCQYDGTQFMVRRGDWKYLRLPGEDVLFNLTADPGEMRNVIADPANQETARSLAEAIDHFAASACASPESR